MAVSFSTNFSNPGVVSSKSKPLLPQPILLFSAPFSYKSSIPRLFSTNAMSRRGRYALEKSNGSSNAASVKTIVKKQPQSQFRAKSQSEAKEVDASTEVASELKQMPREKKMTEQEGDNLRKLVGTTGIVLAVIAGSTAALLSVNAILAELSDKVFDGRIKIQDFF